MHPIGCSRQLSRSGSALLGHRVRSGLVEHCAYRGGYVFPHSPPPFWRFSRPRDSPRPRATRKLHGYVTVPEGVGLCDACGSLWPAGEKPIRLWTQKNSGCARLCVLASSGHLGPGRLSAARGLGRASRAAFPPLLCNRFSGPALGVHHTVPAFPHRWSAASTQGKLSGDAVHSYTN
jgi:hypothetical protein